MYGLSCLVEEKELFNLGIGITPPILNEPNTIISTNFAILLNSEEVYR